MSASERPYRSRMIPLADDPPVSVHVLAAFIFCRRAGLFTHESQRDDTGEEESVRPRLDFLPRYDLLAIQKARLEQLNHFWALLGVLVVVLLTTGLLSLAIDARVRWLGLVVVVINAGLLVLTGAQVVILTYRRHRALAARPRQLPVEFVKKVPVNWWELRASGFEPRRYQHALEDDLWRVRGKPWLVLVGGDLCIPVFRKRSDDPELKDQHYARIAAYCHLIQKCVGASSPYGIILLGSSYNGFAIPNFPGSRKVFHRGLQDARRLIKQSDENTLIEAPPESRCNKCPFGRPVVYRAGITEHTSRGVPLAVHGAPRQGRTYHSGCGDRFEWIPPHEKAIELGLTHRR